MPLNPDYINHLNRHLSHNIHEMKGWCVPHLWQGLWPLVGRIGLGSVAEIGVLEGKFLVSLIKTFDPHGQHTHAAIDVFDMQEFNVDNAGIGQAKRLHANLEKQGIDPERTEKVRTDSLALRQADASALVHRHGKFKFFSVDGCHDVTHTTHDIEFAMEVTDSAGIIAVDDYMNPNWPGVNEAVAKMYLLRNFAFIPLFFTCNKLFLCSAGYHQEYLGLIKAYIKHNHPETELRPALRFGYNTLTIKPGLSHWEPLKGF